MNAANVFIATIEPANAIGVMPFISGSYRQ